MKLERIAIAMAVFGVIALAFARCHRRATPAPPPAKRPAPAPAPPPSCHRHADPSSYEVCVVDEAGHGIAGARVFALRNRMIEAYGDVLFYDEVVGVARSDATGLATFLLPAKMELWAVAQYDAWPAAKVESGEVVLGPPRTLHGRVELAAACPDPRRACLSSSSGRTSTACRRRTAPRSTRTPTAR